MIKYSLIFFLMLSGLWLSAQPPVNESDYDKTYKSRISKDVLYGVYIPEDLTDAFIQLNKLIDKESKAKFKNMPEAAAAVKLHFSFGRWIIHNWGFYGGSRLSHYLNNMGVYNPDEMAKFIIITYHRNLNRKPLEVKKLLETFKEEREKAATSKKGKQKVVSEQVRKLSPEEIKQLQEKEKNKDGQ